MRLMIFLALVLALTATVIGTAGASPRTSCPNGYFSWPVPQNEGELRALERIADGLDADPAPYTVGDLIALGNLIDANGDGDFCLKAISNLRGSSDRQWGFFYGARDNDAAAS